MYKYIEEIIPKLNNQNDTFLEISLGKKLEPNIFDTKIPFLIINKIKKKLIPLILKKKRNIIKAKIYYNNNLSLYVNNQFQPKCFKENILEHQIFTSSSFDYNLKIANKKMLSIENFPNKFQYHNSIFKIIESYNIDNKFFLNFVENIENDFTFYNIIILITKKNSKTNSILKLLNKYISLI